MKDARPGCSSWPPTSPPPGWASSSASATTTPPNGHAWQHATGATTSPRARFHHPRGSPAARVGAMAIRTVSELTELAAPACIELDAAIESVPAPTEVLTVDAT